MKYVMIADDEPLTRYALRKLISQNLEELEVVEEVDNGMDAYSKAIELKPDIIFMDIKMPGQSGIEASEKILQESPEIHIIILTAYDHFEYIQKALEIGVEGYLLKPISKGNVLKKIEDIVKRIRLNEAKEASRKLIEKNVDAVVQFAERDFIDHIIQSGYEEAVLKDYQRFLGYKISYGYFICLQFEEESGNYYNSNIARERTRNKVTSAISRYLPFMTKYIIASPRGNTIIMFLFDSDTVSSNQAQESQMIGEHLRHKIDLTEHIPVKVSIGRGYKKMEDLRKSFEEAYNVLGQIKMKEVVHIEEAVAITTVNHHDYFISEVDEIKEKIRLGSYEEANKLSVALIDHVLLSQMPIDIMKEHLIQYYYDLRHLVIRSSVDFGGVGSHRIDSVRSLMDVEELKAIIALESKMLIDAMSNRQTSGDQNLTEQLYNYVHKHYKDNLSLDDVALKIGKTSQYTSKLFKDLFDVNFVDYIVNLRLEEAKQLLKTSNYRIKEIAIMTGYDDANYFCRIFKRKVGMTPNEFRRL